MDKGYYDYDYQEPKRKAVEDVAPKNREETQKMLARFGVGTSKPKVEVAKSDIDRISELQNMAMESLGESPEAAASVPHGTE